MSTKMHFERSIMDCSIRSSPSLLAVYTLRCERNRILNITAVFNITFPRLTLDDMQVDCACQTDASSSLADIGHSDKLISSSDARSPLVGHPTTSSAQQQQRRPPTNTRRRVSSSSPAQRLLVLVSVGVLVGFGFLRLRRYLAQSPSQHAW